MQVIFYLYGIYNILEYNNFTNSFIKFNTLIFLNLYLVTLSFLHVMNVECEFIFYESMPLKVGMLLTSMLQALRIQVSVNITHIYIMDDL